MISNFTYSLFREESPLVRIVLALLDLLWKTYLGLLAVVTVALLPGLLILMAGKIIYSLVLIFKGVL